MMRRHEYCGTAGVLQFVRMTGPGWALPIAVYLFIPDVGGHAPAVSLTASGDVIPLHQAIYNR